MFNSRRSATMRDSSPFPSKQLFILGLCRICEPIAFMSIFPYIYFMIESFHMTSDDRLIAIYAGMVTSAFTFAEFSSGMLWGKLSDRVGRKPVLLTGLAGTGLSMLVFGFASNLWVAVFARALGGLLNGNIGVIQTTVAELVTVKEHQARAYTIMPFVWGLGSILGPSLGGALAQPCVSYPSLFRRGTIFESFPYLLPNLVCACVVVFGVLVGFLFLEETHPAKRHERDAGIELGRRVAAFFHGGADSATAGRYEKLADLPSETASLIDEHEPLPGYRSTEGSPQISLPAPPTDVVDVLRLDDADFKADPEKPAPTRAFTRQVVINILGYGILAYHTITFDQMLPVFLSTPDTDPHDNLSLPFKFTGGFGLSTKQVGFILTMQGVYSMLATLLLFPIAVRRLGALNLFRLLAWSYPLLYLTTPYLVLLPPHLRAAGLYPVLLWKCTFANFAFPASAILLANAAPSLLMLGTINGAAASTASFCRGLGPTLAGFLYATGLQRGYSGLVWWATAAVAVGGAVASLWMSEAGNRRDEEEGGGGDEEGGRCGGGGAIQLD